MNSDFRPIPGYPGYVVDKSGCIYGPQHKMLSHQISTDGYYMVGCYVNKVKKKVLVHRAVALAWIPNLKNLPTVDHTNRNRQDNRVENLRWASSRTQCLNKKHKEGVLNERWITKNGKGFQIQIKINNKRIYGGTFSTLPEAVEERDQIALGFQLAGLILDNA